MFGENFEKKGKKSRKSFSKKEGKKDRNEKTYFQEKFHKYFCEAGHQGIEDWEIFLIDTADTEQSLRSKELF